MRTRVSFRGRAVMALAAVFMTIMISPACSGEDGDNRPTVIASLFPQYDFARRIAGEHARVTLLLPPGAESHSYEPTPRDMIRIAQADLFIYTGPYMEPWAKRIASAAGAARVVDASEGIAHRRNEAAPGEDEHEAHEHEHEHGHDEHGDAHFHEFDPHIWLDPVLAKIMVDNIARGLSAMDPEHADSYAANARGLLADLDALDAAFKKTVAEAPRRTLVFGERFAFGYFFSRYGLEEVGAYKSCAPGAEPGLKAVIGVIEYIKAENVRCVYREAMSRARISEVLRKETGVEILEVDSLHNLPADKLDAGATYLDIMRDNMDAFAKGLR